MSAGLSWLVQLNQLQFLAKNNAEFYFLWETNFQLSCKKEIFLALLNTTIESPHQTNKVVEIKELQKSIEEQSLILQDISNKIKS